MTDDDGTTAAVSAPPLARSSDPATSHVSGQAAAVALPHSMQWVMRVMSDGKPRIDEEIYDDAVSGGFKNDSTRTRQGRRVLVRRGILKFTGKTRLTSRKRPAQEWEISPPGYVPPTVDTEGEGHCPTCTCGAEDHE